MGLRQRALHLVVRDDAALFEIDQQHLARLQPPLGDDLLLRNRQHAHFGGHDHEIVVGHEVARRAQAVAVERRPDLPAVREGDRGRPVPGLHQRGMIFVEGAPALVHQRVAGPGLGDQHHHGMGQRIAALHQEFERVVEAGGVRLAFVGDRPELRNVVAEEFGRHRSLARRHPVDVAPQGVDLAVVGDHAIGMGERPRREGVGREALMHQGQSRLEALVRQVAEVAAEAGRQQQALVDDRARRHRHRIETGRAPVREPVHRARDHLAQDVQAPFERVAIGGCPARGRRTTAG